MMCSRQRRSALRTLVSCSLAAAVLIASPAAFVAPAVAGSVYAPLQRVNMLRAWAGLPPVTEDAALSKGAWLHARYMSENNWIGHSEDTKNRWYSSAGAKAGAAGNCALGIYGTDAIDSWARGPFHAIGMIDPLLKTVGFGTYVSSSTGRPAAVLDILTGRTGTSASYPVMWPGQGAVVDMGSYTGGETPDPLKGIGYTTPSGLPLIVQFGTGSATPLVTNSYLRRVNPDGSRTDLDHKWISELTYINADENSQTLGRSLLNARDAVIVVPKLPLLPGVYEVLVDTTPFAGKAEWTFRVLKPTFTTISVKPTDPKSYGATMKASGTLREGSATGTGMKGKSIRIQRSSNGYSGWKTVATLTTGDYGTFSWSAVPRLSGYFRAVYPGATGTHATAVSGLARFNAKAAVGAPKAVRYGTRAYKITGTLKPRHKEGTYPIRIYRWRWEGGKWKPYGYVRAKAYDYRSYTKYVRKHRFPYKGSWLIRSYHVDAGHAPSWSAVTQVNVY